jgi:hypothetical protein
LRPRFLAKGKAGRGYRAIARNGRVLLASDCAVAELSGRIAQVRLQTWHRAILPFEPPESYGVLVVAQCDLRCPEGISYGTRLVKTCEEPFALALDLGGGQTLQVYELAPTVKSATTR